MPCRLPGEVRHNTRCQVLLPTGVKTNTAVSRDHDWRQADTGSETGRQIYYKLQIIRANMNINPTGPEIVLYSVTKNMIVPWYVMLVCCV